MELLFYIWTPTIELHIGFFIDGETESTVNLGGTARTPA